MTRKQQVAQRLLAGVIFRIAPHVDGNEMARSMAERHDSIAPVFETHAMDLETDGVNANLARFISMLPQLARYVQTEAQIQNGKPMASMDACGRYFMARCTGVHHERLFMLCFGAKGELCDRDRGEVFDGTLDETPFYLRTLIERALRCQAKYIVLCHNHPSGAAFASTNDVKATRSMMRMCTMMNLVLLDHLIIADGAVVSMRADSIGDKEFLAQAPGDKRLMRWPK